MLVTGITDNYVHPWRQVFKMEALLSVGYWKVVWRYPYFFLIFVF